MKRASTRAARADLSRFLPFAATNPKTPVTKVLVLSNRNARGCETDYGSELTPLAGFRVSASRLNALSYVRNAFPKGVPWTEFPAVSDPWCIFDPVLKGDYSAFEYAQHRSKTSLCVDMADVFADHDAYAIEIIKYATDPLEFSLDLFRFVSTVKALGNVGVPVFLRVVTGIENGKRDGEWVCVQIEDLLNEHRAYAAFRYSYSLNFRAVAMKAIRAATDWDDYDSWTRELRDADKSAVFRNVWAVIRASSWRFRCGGVPAGLEHPLATQLLFTMRRRGSIAAPSRGHFEYRNLVSELLAEEADGRRVRWLGNGKYKPALIGGIRQAALDLFACGLINLDSENAVSLSSAGQRFLDMIHPDCEDPDVLIRWIDPATGFVPPDRGGSADNWIVKHFMKMKTRVNLIPSEQTLVAPVVDRSDIPREWRNITSNDDPDGIAPMSGERV